jgi:protocatechuate 3,4-dioxygenase beta subunit
MKVKLLTFVALLSAGMLAVWLLLPQKGPGGGAAGTTERAAALRATGAAGDTDREDALLAEVVGAGGSPATDTAGEGLSADGQRLAVAAPGEAPLPTWPDAETRWLEAYVVLPEGTPSNEQAFVAALAVEVPADELFGDSGPFVALAEGREVRRVAQVLAGAAVGLDGIARLALPPGTNEAWLAVGGRYVHSLEAQRFDLTTATQPVRLRPALGAWITGVLRSSERSPASAVQVELAWSITTALRLGTASAGDLDREVKSDAEGRFEFRAVPVGRPIQLATDESSLARYFSEDLTLKAGEHRDLMLTLTAGGTLRGRVVDESGNPLQGAEVAVVGREFFGSPTEKLREVNSAADGRFELAGVTPGDVWLRGEQDGYQTQLGVKYQLNDGQVLEVADIVLGRGLAIAGRVAFPDGRPAAGARIELKPDLGENVAGSPVDPRAFIGAGNDAEADQNGAFAITGLGAGPWAVTVEHKVAADGENSQVGRWTAHQALVRAPREDLALTLEPPVNLMGTVTDSQGLPITAFRVRGERAGSQWYMPPSETEQEHFESAEGSFVLTGLRSGDWTFTVEAEGMARSAELALKLPVDEAQKFVLYRPVTLTGRVLDPFGAPVAGAEVAKELEGTEVFEAVQGRGDWLKAVSDEEGNFELAGMAPGTGSLVAKKDGWAPSAASPYELSEGQSLEDVVLTLRRGGTIEGEVFDSSGKPADGCMVILQLPTLEERRMTNADSLGRFEEAGLKPGTWQVQAFPGIKTFEAEDGKALDQVALMKVLKIVSVELADEAVEHVVLGAPPASPVRVRGRVTHSGAPLGDLLVSFIQGGSKGIAGLKVVKTQADGSFETQIDEPGDYLVTVQAVSTTGTQSSVEFRRAIPKVEEHELNLSLPLGRIVGRVVGPNREPLDNTRVTLTMQSGQVFGTIMGGQYEEAVTKADGSYEIRFLRPGTYTVAAGGSKLGGFLGEGQSLGREVQTAAVEEGGSVTLDFELELPGRVEGIVRDSASKPVAEASIFLRDGQGRLVELISFQATNATGKFEYEGLAPGEYTISARTKDQSSATNTAIRIRSGETTQADIAVDAGTMLLVSLVDTTDADIRSRVSVLDEQGREMSGMLSLTELMQRINGGLDDKVQRVGPLAPGTYEVRAFAEDGRSTSKKVTLSGQPERKLNLRLK